MAKAGSHPANERKNFSCELLLTSKMQSIIKCFSTFYELLFFTLCIKSLRTGYLFVHMHADGSVFCQRLCVRRSGGQLVLTELRAEMGKQERQARHEVSGTPPPTTWTKQTCMPHMLRLIIVVWRTKENLSLYCLPLPPH